MKCLAKPWASLLPSLLRREYSNFEYKLDHTRASWMRGSIKAIVWPPTFNAEKISNCLWYLFKSVGGIIWLRWDYQRWWKACKEANSQRGDRRWPAKPPPMGKLVWSSKCFGDFYSRDFLPCLVRTGPLYRGLGVVIFLVTSPRFMEAREFGYNFPNG